MMVYIIIFIDLGSKHFYSFTVSFKSNIMLKKNIVVNKIVLFYGIIWYYWPDITRPFLI